MLIALTVSAQAIETVTVDANGNELPMKDPAKHHILRSDTTKKFGSTEKAIGNVLDTRAVNTANSVSGGGNLAADRTIQLSGDSATPGNSKYYGTNGSGTRGYYDLPAGSSSSGANPSVSVGLSAVNGSASTFMRSDAAPALDQGIAPSWTALHTWRNDSLTTSGDDTTGIVLFNNNTSLFSNGNGIRVSPEIRFHGTEWHGNSFGSSHTGDIRMFYGGFNANQAPGSGLRLEYSDNGGAYSVLGMFGATGSLYIGGFPTADVGNGVIASATGYRIGISSPTSGHVLRSNGTNFVDGQPAVGDITGFGTGIATALGNGFGTTSTTFASGDHGVTTLSLATPNVFYATPVTFSNSSGAWTGTLSLNTQSANTVFAGPTTGSAATPAMRALVSADVPTLNQNTTGSAATLTTARAIYGNNFNGSAALTQVIASTYGGTGNGFTKFSGPTTSEKTKTVSDASDTILELGGSYTPTGTWTNMTLVTPALGTPASGVVTNLSGTASININGTVGATTPTTGVFTSETFSLSSKSTTALATPSALSATQYTAFASTVSGASLMGYGTTNDVSLMNRAGTVVLGVGPNTTLVNIPGTFSVTGHTTFEGVTSTGATGSGKLVYDTAPQISTIELGNASDTTIARVGGGQISVEGVNVSTVSSTDSFSNKTLDTASTNTIKRFDYLQLDAPAWGDGTNATRITTDGANYGHFTFSNSVAKASNYVIYRFRVPDNLDTAIDLKAAFTFRLTNTDTGKHSYYISMADVAASAGADAPTFSNEIALSFAGDASGAANDIEQVSYTTLTTWKSSLTGGHMMLVKVARDGNDGTLDTSTVNSTDVNLTLRYAISSTSSQ